MQYKDKIKHGTILILYHKNLPKIQGICVSTFDTYCILRSLQSGYNFKVFYSNPYLKVSQIKDIDFYFLRFVRIKFSLLNINFRVFRNLSKM